MLREPNEEGAKIGRKMNWAKTRCMRSEAVSGIRDRVGYEEIEEVEHYIGPSAP